MSKKSRDSSTLFELISQAGGRIKGVTPPKGTDSPQAPTDEAPPAEPPAPPLPELAGPPEQSEPAPVPAAPEPIEQQEPAQPSEDKPADTADEGPAEQAETSTRTEAQAAPPAKPKAKAKKKKAAPKRAAKTAAKAPAGAGGRTKARKRTSAAAGAGTSVRRAAAKAEHRPADELGKAESLPADGEAQPPAEDAPRPMPAGFVPPEYLRPRAQAAPRPSGSQSITPAPPLPLIAAAVAIVLMIVTFVVGFIAGGASAPRGAAGQDSQTNVASMNTGQPDGGQPGASGRIDGMHYLVIQELIGSTTQDRIDAFDIQSFCEGNDCPADVRRYTREDGKVVYAVVSFDPFESPRSPEATAFALKIEELGRQYEAQGGNYRFQQRPSRTAELKPRYEPWREPPQE